MKNMDQQAFFELLRAGLWEKEANLQQSGNVNFHTIMQFAEEQTVIGIITSGLEHVNDVTVSKNDLLQFIGASLQIEQNNTAMNSFIADLVGKMRKAGIYTLLVKGQGVAQCYERPLLRACGDIDLFLSEENYKKAKAFLTPLAINVEKESVYGKHLGMTIDNWVVELHGKLCVSLSRRINKTLSIIQDDIVFNGNVRSWMNGGTQVFLPGVDNDVIYIFTHYLNHFYKGGIGLRQICDWCRLLWTYKNTINTELLKKRLLQMGLVSEWKAFGAFAVDYLGMPADAMPFYSPKRKWTRKANRIRDFIIDVGNFGHNRNMGYYSRYPYVIRKGFSFVRICVDLFRHARILPLDSFRFFPNIMFYGLRSAVRGE